MSDPYRLRYTNQAVGVFLLVVLLFVIGLSVLVLRAGDYFVEKDHYWIEVPQEDVRDLYKGTEVMILGERAGEIDSIQYADSTDKVRLNLSIDPKMSSQIFVDSVVRQDRKFGLGTPILMIRRGATRGAERTRLLPGSALQNYEGQSDRLEAVANQVATVSEAIRLMQEQLEPTLLSMTAASDQLRTTLATSTEPALQETQKAANSFFETNETLRPKTSETLDSVQQATQVMQDKVTQLTREISESADSVRLAADSVARTSDETNEDLAETLASFRKTAEQVQRLAIQTQELVRVIRSEANHLPGTTERLNETVGDTQDLVGEIRGHWLLRNSRDANPPRGGSVRP